MSPYWGADFFSFFKIFFLRLVHGDVALLATDEVQVAVLCCTAISCGLIGPFLVLKKMTMFANSLSHTILLGIVGAFLLLGPTLGLQLPHLFLGALIASFLTAVLTEGLIKGLRLTEDASIGLVFTFLFALGIILATVFLRDLHLGIESVMGNADALLPSDFQFSFFLVLMNGLAILLFYRHFQLISFDSCFAKSLGLPNLFFHFLLLFLVAVTCMSAFRAVGVILVLAFLVGPYLTARLFCHRLSLLLLYSCLGGVAASFCAVSFTRHILSSYDLAISTGGMAVCFIGLFYVIALGLKAAIKKLSENKGRQNINRC